MVAKDRFVLGILWQQPCVAVPLPECLYSCLVVEQGCNNISVVGALLPPYDNPIAITDGCVDHGIPGDPKHEQFAMANQLSRKGHNVLDDLVRQDGAAGSDATDEGNHGRIRRTAEF
jgi:hypothetical protein